MRNETARAYSSGERGGSAEVATWARFLKRQAWRRREAGDHGNRRVYASAHEKASPIPGPQAEGQGKTLRRLGQGFVATAPSRLYRLCVSPAASVGPTRSQRRQSGTLRGGRGARWSWPAVDRRDGRGPVSSRAKLECVRMV